MVLMGRRRRSAAQLNDFLRREMAAVEAYRLALSKLDGRNATRPLLERCLASHVQRTELLRRKILEVGGLPVNASPTTGAFAKVSEVNVTAFADEPVIAALEECEDRELERYCAESDGLGTDARQLLTTALVPAQRQTYQVLMNLKQALQ